MNESIKQIMRRDLCRFLCESVFQPNSVSRVSFIGAPQDGRTGMRFPLPVSYWFCF